mgnify:CR=1 FL=1
MCFGSGAPQYKKPDFGDLPSTSVDTSNGRKAPALKDVKLTRKGQKTRSLLSPNMTNTYGGDT